MITLTHRLPTRPTHHLKHLPVSIEKYLTVAQLSLGSSQEHWAKTSHTSTSSGQGWGRPSLTLWTAILRLTAAGAIATETGSALNAGNDVQGTVLMLLRKRTSTEPAFKNNRPHNIGQEVVRQLNPLKALNGSSQPKAGNAEDGPAVHAAALHVPTAHPTEAADAGREISRSRVQDALSLMEQAAGMSCRIPRGVERDRWRIPTPHERSSFKRQEVAAPAKSRSGVDIELAGGTGASDYAEPFGRSKANSVRLATPTELGCRELEKDRGPMGGTLLRHRLLAVSRTNRRDPREGKRWLQHEPGGGSWAGLARMTGFPTCLADMGRTEGAEHGQENALTAPLLCSVLENDRVRVR